MTTVATLSGLNAASVNAAMKSKLADAFAAATGTSRIAVRVGSVTDVAAASRRRLAATASVTVWPRMSTHLALIVLAPWCRLR